MPKQLTYWEQMYKDTEDKKKLLRKNNQCVTCYNKGVSTPADGYTGAGWGFCQQHGKENDAMHLANWKRICTTIAEIDTLTTIIKEG